jgi:hypothetical protein
MSAEPIMPIMPEVSDEYPADSQAVRGEPAVADAFTQEEKARLGQPTRAATYEDDDFADIPMRLAP